MLDQNTRRTAITSAAGALANCALLINEYLKHPELQVFRTRILNQLSKSQTLLGVQNGVHVQNHNQQSIEEIIKSFEPMTDSIMGEKLDRVLPVTGEDLNISDDAKEKFLEDRDVLYDRLPDMSNDELYRLAKQPNGAALIRSVAKKAGHPQFRDREMNDEFLAEIRDAITTTAQINSTIINATGDNTLGQDDDDLTEAAGTTGLSDEERKRQAAIFGGNVGGSITDPA